MSSFFKDTNKHVHHTYAKSRSKSEDWKSQIYRCIDPDCRHYDRAVNLEAKRAKCAEYGCSEIIVIELKQLRKKRTKLVCLGCTKSPLNKEDEIQGLKNKEESQRRHASEKELDDRTEAEKQAKTQAKLTGEANDPLRNLTGTYESKKQKKAMLAIMKMFNWDEKTVLNYLNAYPANAQLNFTGRSSKQ